MPILYHPGLGRQVNYSITVVGDDPDEQVAATIALMRRYVREDWGTELIRRDALQAQSESGYQDPASAVFRFIKTRLRFVKDETTLEPFAFSPELPGVEALIRPVDMAMQPAGRQIGDCDDYVMYGAALLKALGVDSRFVTVAADPADPSRYSHVYLAAYQDGYRIPLDLSHGDYPGWETGNPYGKRREWEIFGPELAPMVGLLIGAGALALMARKK